MCAAHHLTLTSPPSSSSSSSSSHSPGLIHMPSQRYSASSSKLSMELPQVRCVRWQICIMYTHTRMCRSVCESSLVSSPFWSTKGRVGLTAVQGRAGCRCNIFLSIFISFRLPGWLEALTGIYCHLTRLHLLCFTAQHAGWAIPYQMDWMSL